jgi:predicted P-loop ATPase
MTIKTKNVRNQSTPLDERVEAASQLISAGFDLIPLKPREKIPLAKGWRNQTRLSEITLMKHLRKGDNIGVRLKPGEIVIDVDPRNGGKDSFQRLRRELKLDPTEWPCVTTGSGGQHFYLRIDPALEIRGKLYEGIDIKKDGGFVVAPGSIHPNGEQYIWANAEIWLGEVPKAPKALIDAIRKSAREETTAEGGEYTPEEISSMLKRLDPEKFASDEKWTKLAMAVHHASGGEARAEFLAWSAHDYKYHGDEANNEKRWDSFRADPKLKQIKVGTLHYFLEEAGAADAIPRRSAAEDFADAEPVEPTKEVSSSTSKALTVNRSQAAADTYANSLRAIARSQINPAWDTLKQKVVFRGERLPWAETYGREFDDHVLRMVRVFLMDRYQGNDFQPSKDNVFEAIQALAYNRKFNPVLEYMDGLEWDGVERVERLFADYFHTEDDKYTSAVSRCFMIGAVRRMRHPGSKFDTMPVLKGPQGWNKSTGIKALFGAEWFSDADLGNLRSKDAALVLRGIWVQEFAELDAMNRAETATLKAFCSRQADRMRDPYERVVRDTPRCCVFVGTVNEGGYLKDTTGSRRFWPLTIQAPIEVERLAADRDQLWAEASALEALGESDVLPEQLWPVAAERQAEEATFDPWADELSSYLSVRAKDADEQELGSPDKVHTSELRMALGIDAIRATKGADQRIRTVMENMLGWKYRRGVRVGEKIAAGYVQEA